MRSGIQLQLLTVRAVSYLAMNASLFHTRQISLALLVVAVVEHGHLNIPDVSSGSCSSALLRLGRDFIRRTSHIPSSQMMDAAPTGAVAAFKPLRPNPV
jgi:hypothetical protein